VAHVQKILANLKAQTGLDLPGWVARVQAQGPLDLRAAKDWLRGQGLGTVQATFVAERAMGKAGGFDDTAEGYLAAAPGYVAAQFAGRRAAFEPLFDLLDRQVRALGPDVKVCPCQTQIPFYRHHVFAEVRTLASRLDLGLSLGDPAQVKDPSGRLEDTGGFARRDRITHRVSLRGAEDLDATVLAWLRTAYDRDAKA
jgi:predicted transport protein